MRAVLIATLCFSILLTPSVSAVNAPSMEKRTYRTPAVPAPIIPRTLRRARLEGDMRRSALQNAPRAKFRSPHSTTIRGGNPLNPAARKPTRRALLKRHSGSGSTAR